MKLIVLHIAYRTGLRISISKNLNLIIQMYSFLASSTTEQKESKTKTGFLILIFP